MPGAPTDELLASVGGDDYPEWINHIETARGSPYPVRLAAEITVDR